MSAESIAGARGGKEQAYGVKMRRYLEILIGALLQHKKYRDVISSWDGNIFLMSAQMYEQGNGAAAEQESAEQGRLLQHAEVFAGSHREKWDGTGYPHGLKGEAIPLQGRIMAIVDTYNALTTDRSHRSRKTHKEAVETIMNGSGTHFEPGLVDAFLECEKEFAKTSNY